MKNFKKAVWILTVALVLSVSTAWAAQSALVGGDTQKGDVSLEREIEGGIKITLQEIYKNNNYVWVRYVALSEEDTVVKVNAERDNGALFDDRGNQFTYSDVNIANLNTREREIIAGVPTAIFVGYRPGDKYTMPKKFARVAINVNGKKLLFRDVPGSQGDQ
jgi:hypothetical protein